MFPITERHLAAIGVRQKEIDLYLLPLNDAMVEHDITILERPAMFVAQVAHESGRMRYTSELWGPTAQQLRYDDNGPLARKLGNPYGEGFKWRGHGLIQVTGFYNHSAESKHFGVPMSDIVDWLQTPVGASRSAAHFWASHGCNRLADDYDFVGVTEAINGGRTGLKERTALYTLLTPS